ncbi:hypothetical protein Tco_0732568 [Tanacetum coccineum]
MEEVCNKLKYYIETIDKNFIHMTDLVNLIRDTVHLLDSASVFRKANAKGEKWEKANPNLDTSYLNQGDQELKDNEMTNVQLQIPDPTQGEQQLKDDEMASVQKEQPPLADPMDEGGSAPKMPNLNQFNTSEEGKLTLDDVKAQMEEMQRLAFLIKEKEKIEKKADQLPITKISNGINNHTKEATMRIERNNQPLSLTVYKKFVMKTLGFSEWIEVYVMASKNKTKANDVLLKNFKAKFQLIKTQAKKLGIPPPPELIAFGLSTVEKKRKRSLEILKDVFVTEDTSVDRMHRNLIPPQGVIGSRGLVITKPEAEIFFSNGNSDLDF